MNIPDAGQAVSLSQPPQLQSEGTHSRQGLSTGEGNCGSDVHDLVCRALSCTEKTGSDIFNSPGELTWLCHNHLQAELPIGFTWMKGSSRARKRQSWQEQNSPSATTKRKGHLSYLHQMFLPEAKVAAHGWAPTTPHLSVTRQAAPFTPDSLLFP